MQPVHFLNCCNNIENSSSAVASNDSNCKLWTHAPTGDTERDSVWRAARKFVIDFFLNIAYNFYEFSIKFEFFCSGKYFSTFHRLLSLRLRTINWCCKSIANFPPQENWFILVAPNASNLSPNNCLYNRIKYYLIKIFSN